MCCIFYSKKKILMNKLSMAQRCFVWTKIITSTSILLTLFEANCESLLRYFFLLYLCQFLNYLSFWYIFLEFVPSFFLWSCANNTKIVWSTLLCTFKTIYPVTLKFLWNFYCCSYQQLNMLTSSNETSSCLSEAPPMDGNADGQVQFQMKTWLI